MAATPVDRETMPSIARRLVEFVRRRPVSTGLGLALGVGIGAWYRYLESEPPTGFIPKIASAIVVAAAVMLVLAVVGAVLATWPATRQLSRAAFATLGVMVIALPAGYVIGAVAGPRWQGPRSMTGVVRFVLTDPAGEYSGSATCETEANADTVVSVVAPAIGLVDGGSLGANLFWGGEQGVVELGLDGGSDLTGHLRDEQADATRTSGSASFDNLVVDALDPDPDVSWTTASGSVSWSCG